MSSYDVLRWNQQRGEFEYGRRRSEIAPGHPWVSDINNRVDGRDASLE